MVHLADWRLAPVLVYVAGFTLKLQASRSCYRVNSAPHLYYWLFKPRNLLAWAADQILPEDYYKAAAARESIAINICHVPHVPVDPCRK